MIADKIIYSLPEGPSTYFYQPFGKPCVALFSEHCELIDRSKRHTKLSVSFDPCLKDSMVGGIFIPEQNCFVMDTVHKGVSLDYIAQHVHQHKSMILFLIAIQSTELIEPGYPYYSIKVVQDKSYQYIPPKNIFLVKSTPKSDIYELYKNNQLHSIACIDTYACSQSMNKLFHPTDDYQEKSLWLECTWNETFKKWTPKLS